MDEEVLLCPHCFGIWDGVYCLECGFSVFRMDPYYD